MVNFFPRQLVPPNLPARVVVQTEIIFASGQEGNKSTEVTADGNF